MYTREGGALAIEQVQEFFADVFAVNDQLFSLNMLSTIGLTSDHSTSASSRNSVNEECASEESV